MPRPGEVGRRRGVYGLWGACMMWGPGAFYTEYEPYSGTPQGNHLVQYFDKGRLEINDPQGDKSSPWYITSGLLVKEMVSGGGSTGGGSLTVSAPRMWRWRAMATAGRPMRSSRTSPGELIIKRASNWGTHRFCA